MIADILLFISILVAVFAVRRWLRGSRSRPATSPLGQILVDGSNVMFWDGEVPKIETILRVIGTLHDKGYETGVIFDANVGYKLFGRFHGEGEMANLLLLPKNNVIVVPRGTPADEYLLSAARQFGARIVTNDRYRDWIGQFPELSTPGYLLRGGVRAGRVWVEAA